MPQSSPPLDPLPSSARKQLLGIRLLSAATMQFGYLLVPLLVFHLTSSLGMVAAALLFDGLARAGAQVVSGDLLARMGPAKVHALTETLRLIALGGLFLCANGTLPASLVVAMGFCLQVSTAATITLYAHTTSGYWPASEQANAHHLQGYAEQWGCLLALTLAMLVPEPVPLTTIGLVLQAAVWVALLSRLSSLHPKTHFLPATGTMIARMARDGSACVRRPLLRLSMGSICLYAAVLVGFSLPVFMFADAEIAPAEVGRWVAGALLLKTLVALGAMYLVKRRAARGGSFAAVSRLGHGLALLGLAGMAAPLPPVFKGIALVTMGTGAALFTPQLRFIRQRLISQMVDPRSRAGATGMLSALDAVGFAVAAALVACATSLPWVYALALGVGVLGAPLLEDGYARSRS